MANQPQHKMIKEAIAKRDIGINNTNLGDADLCQTSFANADLSLPAQGQANC